MNEIIIDSIHKIANHIYKQKGYFVTIKREDVATILEAAILLNNKIEEDNKQNNEN